MVNSTVSNYLQASITADVSAATQTMTVTKETLYIHEEDRDGSLVVCQVENYANFDVSATTFVNGISYKTGGSDESGNTFEFNGTATAAAATLYDVHFASGSFQNSTSALVSDLITINASNVGVKELEFSGAGITGANKVAFDSDGLDASHGTLTFDFGYDISGVDTDSSISTQIVYSVDDDTTGTLTVTKDDNVLASDKVGFGTDNSGAPTVNADDVLTADLTLSNSLFANQTVNFTGSVSAITITDAALTSAINEIVDHSNNLADAQDDIAAVRSAILDKIEDNTFRGLTTTTANNISIDLKLQVGSQAVTTETIENIRPQVFFGKYTRAELDDAAVTTALSS